MVIYLAANLRQVQRMEAFTRVVFYLAANVQRVEGMEAFTRVVFLPGC